MMIRLLGVSVLAAACLTGCYERVISEKPFPGMAARRVDGPTAPDYREAQANFQRQVESRNQKPFNPLGAIGEGIGGAVGGVAKGIGSVFGGDSADPAKPAVNPARPVTSAGDVSKPAPAKTASDSPPPANGGSPFDAAP